MKKLIIYEIKTDFSIQQLTILGENFSNGKTLSVTLGTKPLKVIQYTDHDIILELDNTIANGGYLLKVSTGSSVIQNISFDLNISIGLIGPKGPKGDKGEPGPKGNDGYGIIYTNRLPPLNQESRGKIYYLYAGGTGPGIPAWGGDRLWLGYFGGNNDWRYIQLER